MKRASLFLLLLPVALHAQSAADAASRSFQDQYEINSHREEQLREKRLKELSDDKTTTPTVGLFFQAELPPAFLEPASAPPFLQPYLPYGVNRTKRSRQLSPFLHSSFYSGLAELITRNSPSEKLFQKLKLHTTAAESLADEIRHALKNLQGETAESLAKLATQQAARLDSWEQDDDTLRKEIRSNLPNVFELTAPSSPHSEAKQLLEVSFSQDGFSTEQRSLLRLAAYLLLIDEKAPREDWTFSLTENKKQRLFLLPATASLHLPPNLPASLATKISDYQAVLDKITAGLREAVLSQSKTLFAFNRTKAFRSLAAAQAPEIKKLEEMAEGLRRELAPYFVQISLHPALPAELAAQIKTHLHDQQAHRRSLTRKLNQLDQTYPEHTIIFQASREAIELDPQSKIKSEKTRREIQSELDACNVELRKRHAQLLAESAAIRSSLQEVVRRAPAIDKTPTLQTEIVASIETFALHIRYRDYYHAVLTPGLSPAQRRVLFAEALTHLQ